MKNTLSPFIAVVAMCFVPAAAAQSTNYVIEDLGTLGGANSVAMDMNESGAVVGHSEPVGQGAHPFLWSRGRGMVRLDTPGDRGGQALKINEAGDVAGLSLKHVILWTRGRRMVDLGPVPILPEPLDPSSATVVAINSRREILLRMSRFTTSASFVYSESAAPVRLPSLGSDTYATDMNNVGIVCGNSRPPGSEIRGFVWSARTGIIELPTLGGSYARASRINAAGVVLGISTKSGTVGPFSAFLWTPRTGTFELAGATPVGGSSGDLGFHLTPRGDVFGALRTSGTVSAFHWTARTGTQTLPTLGPNPGHLEVRIEGSNARGQACGIEFRGRDFWSWTTHPVVYDAQGRQTELPNLGSYRLSGGRTLLGAPTAMNNAGVIAGNAYPPNSRGHAVIWRPSH